MRKSTLIVSAMTAAFICLEFVGQAHAILVPVITVATNNATVQPAGPRAGQNGKDFLNMQGSAAAANSSFGVVDFTLPSFGGSATNAVGATLQLTQSNIFFSATGPISVYLSTQTGVSIESTNTNLNYVSGNNGLASVDSDLGTLSFLGTTTYTASVPNTAGSGTQDFAPLTLSGGALTSFLAALNSGGTARLIITPDTAGTSATYAGFSNAQFAGPTLAFFAVVSAASIIMLGLGGIALVAGARYSRRSTLQE